MKRLLLVLALVALTGAASLDAPQPSGALAKLGAWEGRWTFSGQIYQTKYSDHHSDSGTADCHWAVGGRNYMICDYFSDNPPHDDLSIISYDATSKTYKRVGVHLNRSTQNETFTQSGDTWTTQSSTQDKGKSLLLRTVFVFVTPTKQTTSVQVSADNGSSWTTMIDVTAVKS